MLPSKGLDLVAEGLKNLSLVLEREYNHLSQGDNNPRGIQNTGYGSRKLTPVVIGEAICLVSSMGMRILAHPIESGRMYNQLSGEQHGK